MCRFAGCGYMRLFVGTLELLCRIIIKQDRIVVIAREETNDNDGRTYDGCRNQGKSRCSRINRIPSFGTGRGDGSSGQTATAPQESRKGKGYERQKGEDSGQQVDPGVSIKRENHSRAFGDKEHERGRSRVQLSPAFGDLPVGVVGNLYPERITWMRGGDGDCSIAENGLCMRVGRIRGRKSGFPEFFRRAVINREGLCIITGRILICRDQRNPKGRLAEPFELAGLPVRIWKCGMAGKGPAQHMNRGRS